MKAMILAAGYGTRLRPVTRNTPKPLVPVVNLPLILHNLLLLKRNGIYEVMVNLHYLADMIPRYLGNGSRWGLDINYSQEKEILGTAGGIEGVKDFFGEETFLVMNSDILIQIDLINAIKYHQKRNALGTMIVSEREDVTRYGAVGLGDENRVYRITNRVGSEKAGLKQTVFLGIHILEPGIFRYFPGKIPSCINADVYPCVIRSGGLIQGYIQRQGYWSDLGTASDYLQAHWDILDGKPGPVSGNSLPCRIDPSARTIEPVRFGSDVIIGAGAVVGPYCVVGDRVRVGENSRVTNSVLWNESRIHSDVNIKDSIVENETQVISGSYFGKFITSEGAWDLQPE